MNPKNLFDSKEMLCREQLQEREITSLRILAKKTITWTVCQSHLPLTKKALSLMISLQILNLAQKTHAGSVTSFIRAINTLNAAFLTRNFARNCAFRDTRPITSWSANLELEIGTAAKSLSKLTVSSTLGSTFARKFVSTMMMIFAATTKWKNRQHVCKPKKMPS